MYRIYRGIQLGDGGGTCAYGVEGGLTGGVGHVAGSGPYSQVGKEILCHWPCGGDVEGSSSDF